MASFTDSQMPRFNPYIQQQPVEAMVAVGAQKQKAYEEGVQKIQTQIDNIAGLDVMREVDKAYLQSKMNQLGNNLRSVASGDFSNFQLVNSVNGMTKQIIQDKGVQNAISSTARVRKEQTFMEEERKKGTLDPSNEFHFNKKLGSWLGDSDVNTAFTGKYVPYFDVHKYAKEVFDAEKPDGFSYDQIYQLDANGQPMHDKRGNLIYSTTMTRLEKEGLFPEKVKQTLAQIFSEPRVSEQLGISGEYNYRNYDSNSLNKIVSGQREKLSSAYTNQIYNLSLQKSLGKDTTDEIESTKRALDNTLDSYDNYSQLAYTNPDAIRGQLYKDDVNARYTTMFGWTKEKKQVMDNPAWKAEFDMQKEANEQSRFAQTLSQTKQAHADDIRYKYTALAQQKELAEAALEAKGKGKKPIVAYGSGTGPTGAAPEKDTEPASIQPSVVQENNFNTAKDNYAVANDSFLWQTVFKGVGGNNEKLQGLIDNGMTEQEAMNHMINNAASKSKQTPAEYRSGWTRHAVSQYMAKSPDEKAKLGSITGAYNLYQDASRTFNNELQIKNQSDKQLKLRLGDFADKIAMTNIKPQEITFLDKTYHIDKGDMMDLAIYKKAYFNNFATGTENKAAEEALRRLSQKGKGELVNAMTSDKAFSPQSIGQVVPFLKEVVKDVGGLRSLYRVFAYESEGGKPIDWSSVDKIGDMLDSEVYSKAMIEKEKIINEAYGIKPNLKIGLVTGKASDDAATLANIKRFTGAGGGNLSPDADEFASSLGTTMKDNNIEAKIIIGPNNEPRVELVSYDTTGKRIGGRVLEPDEAATLNIDVNALYESREISSLRSRMKYNGNQTSAGDPMDTTTYRQGDSYYNQTDFPLLDGSGIDAQANFLYSNNNYYPYLFVSDGKNSTVRQLPGLPNLEQAAQSVKKVDQTIAKKILIGQ